MGQVRGLKTSPIGESKQQAVWKLYTRTHRESFRLNRINVH